MADVQPSGDDSSSKSKHRKLSDSASSSPLICFADLPSGVLEHAASFLAAPSRVLFLQALHDGDDAPSSSSAIVGSHEVLDFGQIEKDLAEKLSDDDIQKILQHTDAVNKVKKLLLTNCMKITGAGLEPLRGSAVIEQIDLSILEFAGNRDPSISCDHVLPILDSIIEREGTAVQYLQFPAKWRNGSVVDSEFTESDFHAFLERYNEMWERRGDIYCPECVKDFPDYRMEGPWVDTSAKRGGANYFVCYGCLKYSCGECKDFDSYRHFCSKCARTYCIDCAQIYYCAACDEMYCVDHCATFYNCDGISTEFYNMRCGQSICEDCAYSKERECRSCKKSYCSFDCSNRTYREHEIERCDHCSSFLCYECENSSNSSNLCVCADEIIDNVLPGRHEIDELRKCDECNKAACPDCQLQFGKSVEKLDCKGCIKMIVSALLKEKELNKKLAAQNEELRSGNKDLQDTIKWQTERLESYCAQIAELKEENTISI